jgi:hypothetical protein
MKTLLVLNLIATSALFLYVSFDGVAVAQGTRLKLVEAQAFNVLDEAGRIRARLSMRTGCNTPQKLDRWLS